MACVCITKSYRFYGDSLCSKFRLNINEGHFNIPTVDGNCIMDIVGLKFRENLLYRFFILLLLWRTVWGVTASCPRGDWSPQDVPQSWGMASWTSEAAEVFLELFPTAEAGRPGVYWVDRYSGYSTHALRLKSIHRVKKWSAKQIYLHNYYHITSTTYNSPLRNFGIFLLKDFLPTTTLARWEDTRFARFLSLCIAFFPLWIAPLFGCYDT